MKIAHVSSYCHLASTGGTERYIRDLITGLNRRGIQSEIGWMAGEGDALRARDEVTVHRLPRAAMRVDDPPAELASLARAWLDRADRPDLLHFHTFGRSEEEVATLAMERNIPFAFTYHSPSWTCRRETLLRWGHTVCDGEVRPLRCAACLLQERFGGPAWLGGLGALGSGLIGPLIPPGPWRRRLAFTADTARLRGAVHHFLGACALNVACAEWSIPLLKLNGARPDSILHLPQGVPEGFHGGPVCRPSPEHLVIGYVGRMIEIKGLHILVEAFRRVSYARARLRVCGFSKAPELAAYARRLRKLAGDDPRITFVPEKPASEIPAEYAQLSLLAIPSAWLETGPLTLLEALSAGVPVYASSHIGQRGLLERNGRIVEPNTPAAWAAALEEACRQHEAGRWTARTVTEHIPTMDDVSERMARAYREVLGA